MRATTCSNSAFPRARCISAQSVIAATRLALYLPSLIFVAAMSFELANVSGKMFRAGDQLKMQLEVDTMLAARPADPAAAVQPEASSVLTRPTAEQVEQLAVQLASPRLQQWEAQQTRLARIRTQLKHTQTKTIANMLKLGSPLPHNIDVKTFWSESAQASLLVWLRGGPQAALEDDTTPRPALQDAPQAALEDDTTPRPALQDEPSGEQAQASDAESSSDDSSSSDDEEASDSGAGKPPGDSDEADVVVAVPEVPEEDPRTKEELLMCITQLELDNSRLEKEKDDMELQNGALVQVNHRLVEDREDAQDIARRQKATIEFLEAEVARLRVEVAPLKRKRVNEEYGLDADA